MINKKLEKELRKFMQSKGVGKENIREILGDLREKIDEHEKETKYNKRGKEVGVGYGTSCFCVETKDGRRPIEF